MEYDACIRGRTIFFFRESDFLEFGRMVFSSKIAFFSRKMKLVVVAVLPLLTRRFQISTKISESKSFFKNWVRLTPRIRIHYCLFWFTLHKKGVGLRSTLLTKYISHDHDFVTCWIIPTCPFCDFSQRFWDKVWSSSFTNLSAHHTFTCN
jgi:hypothetical protein